MAPYPEAVGKGVDYYNEELHKSNLVGDFIENVLRELEKKSGEKPIFLGLIIENIGELGYLIHPLVEMREQQFALGGEDFGEIFPCESGGQNNLWINWGGKIGKVYYPQLEGKITIRETTLVMKALDGSGQKESGVVRVLGQGPLAYKIRNTFQIEKRPRLPLLSCYYAIEDGLRRASFIENHRIPI